MAKDLYEILGVPRSADKETIRKEYKKLARRFHPDVNPGDKEAERRFKEINAAHAVLSDAEKRKLYDEFGELALQSGFDEKRARILREGGVRAGGRGSEGFQQGEEFDWTDYAGAGPSFEDLFGDIFGGRRRGRRARGPAPGEDVAAQTEIDFLTAVKGGTVRLLLDGGGGRETIELRIPPGVRDGQRLRLAGLGAPGERGGPSGDLYVTIVVSPHPLFSREGDDLQVEVPITIGEAIAGAKVVFPTPSGEVTLTVPPLTQSGRRFRLRGLGVPSRGGKGDLYARVVVFVPEKGGKEARELAQKLDRFYEGDVRKGLVL